MSLVETTLTFETLLTRQEGSTLVITLNRPEVCNAINWEMEQDLYEALRRVQEIDEIRAVVLMGAGEMFSAGHDLKQVASEWGRDDAPMNDGAYWARNPNLLPSWRFDKLLIGAVHGFAGPYATAILLTCDFRIAARGTRFSFEHARLSTGAFFGQYVTLLFHLPMSVIKQLWLVGGWMDAETARQLHFVQRVVDQSDLEDVALHWAEQISLIDLDAFRSKKRGLHDLYETLGIEQMMEVARDPLVIPSDRETKDRFYRLVQGRGLVEALKDRDTGVDPSVSQV